MLIIEDSGFWTRSSANGENVPRFFSQAADPTDAQQVFIRMPGRPIITNRNGLLY